VKGAGLFLNGPARSYTPDAAKAPEGASTRSFPLLRFPASGSFPEWTSAEAVAHWPCF